MKVDAGLGHQLEKVPAAVKAFEAQGFDGVATSEMNHDPFFPLVLAAEHSTKIDLITSIAVGFARSPMLLANIGHDLNAYSKGRVTIGLGSQIKPHITKRFSMPWGAPAAKMRELVELVRRRQARVRRQVLQPHADDAGFHAREQGIRRAEGHPCCGRAAHD